MNRQTVSVWRRLFPSRSVPAKMAQVGAATYQASVQTETTVTHYFTLRYRSGITADHEVVLSGGFTGCGVCAI